MIYLDNGATTWPKPPAVLKELNRCFKYYAANPGRSGHDMAVKTADMVYECRNAVSDFFGMDSPERVIFTLNATHALNIAIKGSLRADSHVIITSMEHNSVLRPVCGLGIDYDIVEADEYGYVNPQDIESKIKSNTHLIVCTLASNVCGSVQPFEKIVRIAKKYNIPFLLDASQGAGVIKIDMQQTGIDMLAAPGHKGLYGPTGTGVLCINTDNLPDTLIEGGTGSRSKESVQPPELPDRYESGTLNVLGIAGLKEGIAFIEKIGTDGIFHHENKLSNMLAEDLSVIPGVRLAGYSADRPRIGVVSAVIEGIDCISVAQQLNSEYGIAVRAGYHCAYTAHCSIGTGDIGTVRFSLGIYNTTDEIKKTAYAVNRIARQAR